VGVIVSILQAQMDSIAKVLFFEKKKDTRFFMFWWFCPGL